MRAIRRTLVSLVLVFPACSSSSERAPGGLLDASSDERDASDDGAGAHVLWQPKPGTSWQWQLSGALDTTIEVDMYDIDLFNTSPAEIASLHAQGRKVVCYFDTAYEPYRPDEAALRPFRGKEIEGWEDQNWLNVREPKVVEVMKQRIALAAEKGCDGIEADDVEVESNDTGFDLSISDQRTFIRALSSEAHRLGLAYGLKNTLDDIAAMLEDVDFAVNEECAGYNECSKLSPFITAGKAVFHVEYAEDGTSLSARGAEVCPKTAPLGLDTLIKYLDLEADRYACP